VPIADVDRDITLLQNSLPLCPRSHPERIKLVYKLAKRRYERHYVSQEKEDLDKYIIHLTETILLLPVSGAGLRDIPRLLFDLTAALRERSEKYEQPEGIEYSINCLRYLRTFPIDSFDIPRSDVTTSLIRVLCTQVELGAGSETRDIKEMVALCRELLNSNLLGDFPFAAFLSLAKAVYAEYRRGRPIELLDEVIECLRDAVKVCPLGSDNASSRLRLSVAGQLRIRFMTAVAAPSLDDYEEAMALLEKILDSNQPGWCPDSIWEEASLLATELAVARDTFFRGNPEYSSVAISRLRAILSASFIDDEELRFEFTEALSMRVRDRFDHYSLSESLEEANSNFSQLVGHSTSLILEKSGMLRSERRGLRDTYSTAALHQKIQNLEELLSNTPPGTERHKECLSVLADWYETKFHRTKDISDIQNSIKYRRMSLDATLAGDPWRITSLIALINILLLGFEETREISYLNESIAIRYDILKLKSADHFRITQGLVASLCVRGKRLGQIEDLHEAIRLISMTINDQNALAPEPDRFRLSCQWAILARNTLHPTTLTAYNTAMSLMQKSLSFVPTVSVQHTRLVAMGEHCQTMPLDYASYQITFGQFEAAVETLEEGRALLWSQMRGLRTSVAQLVQDSPLVQRLAEINQELEVMTKSVTPSGRPEIEDGVAQDGSDPFGRLVIKWKKLIEERDALISQIQSQPGLEGFLRAPSFTTLRSAASRGPVILINHCVWRSDLVIIVHDSLPCSIPTPDDFFSRANELRDKLVKARKTENGLDSVKYQDALCSVLKGLYELVGEPVIKRLQVLGVPEQSRIWWCPTSVFCSLPLHAMGPIPHSHRYFSDLYIPSYTPSLSALIESRNTSQQVLAGKPSLLLVALPDDDLPGVKGEIKVIRKLEERVAVMDLVSSQATPTSVANGLRGSRLAHFACHGELETGKPFDASFKLHGGSRLTLLEIVRSRLPDAEFAFLSCCHAAEITENSVADEGLHLTSAMQYCGFRSVVGTMWEMADTDGRDLAKSFYKSLFSSQDSSVPYYERSAGALRDAVQKLRYKRGIILERWVNFVHYGA
jgi:CHAT domain-containing protein/tetratricopeptide (TPR) repeat protein